MGLGSTAKKVQKMVEIGEELYTRLNEVRAQLTELRETVEATGERVTALERQNAEQRALIEALVEDRGLDVDEILADDMDADDAEAEG